MELPEKHRLEADAGQIAGGAVLEVFKLPHAKVFDAAHHLRGEVAGIEAKGLDQALSGGAVADGLLLLELLLRCCDLGV